MKNVKLIPFLALVVLVGCDYGQNKELQTQNSRMVLIGRVSTTADPGTDLTKASASDTESRAAAMTSIMKYIANIEDPVSASKAVWEAADSYDGNYKSQIIQFAAIALLRSHFLPIGSPDSAQLKEMNRLTNIAISSGSPEIQTIQETAQILNGNGISLNEDMVKRSVSNFDSYLSNCETCNLTVGDIAPRDLSGLKYSRNLMVSE